MERYRTTTTQCSSRECDISVSGAGEFELVARITARLPQHAGVLIGPGDDGAVVRAPDGRVVVSTDLLVDRRHFRRDWSSPHDVGRRAAGQGLADIVAMGAAPTALVVGVAAPAGLDAAWLDALADGLRAECDPLGVSVVGGDLAAADELTISVTALGSLAGRDPVTRSGAQPGDVVVVAGRLGFAAAGLALLHEGRGDDPLADAHRCPDIAYAAALRLAAAGATAMVDVSDGLVADVGHIARMSGVRIELASDDLPLASELVDAGLSLGADPLAWVAAGGDDHAFAATMSNDAALRAVALLADLPRPVSYTQVGRVVAGPGDVVFVDREPPGVRGHDHFAT